VAAIGEMLQAAVPGGFEIACKAVPLSEVERARGVDDRTAREGPCLLWGRGRGIHCSRTLLRPNQTHFVCEVINLCNRFIEEVVERPRRDQQRL
jgi:hypothetical protein